MQDAFHPRALFTERGPQVRNPAAKPAGRGRIFRAFRRSGSIVASSISSMKKGLLHSLRNAFISGLLVLAPLAITWLVFSWLFERVGGGFRRYFFFFVPSTLLAIPRWASSGTCWRRSSCSS